MSESIAAAPLRDYVAWHQAYDDPQSDLSRRLRRVQKAISSFLDENRGGVRVLSVCAGQGHDILGVLNERVGDRKRVGGTLVEIDPQNCTAAKRRISAQKLRFDIRQADAGRSDTYRGLPPADLLLLVGIMGNIPAEDVKHLIATARQLCAPGATVIWTRGGQEPDLVPDIQAWFKEAGFEEVSLDQVEGTPMHVGVEKLVAEPEPLQPGERIFTFVH